MGSRSLLAGCLLAVAFSQAAGADEFDNTMLLSEGAWTVRHTYDSRDGGSWCAADTSNGDGQWFSVTAYEEGAAAILVGDPRWRLEPRDLRFSIDIDYARWDMQGAGQDDAVSAFLNDDPTAPDLLLRLMQGDAVDVYAESGRRVASFSLDGSAAALQTLLECWALIDRSGESDAAADPFVAASEPL